MNYKAVYAIGVALLVPSVAAFVCSAALGTYAFIFGGTGFIVSVCIISYAGELRGVKPWDE